jgi:hypothetical protein
MKKYLITLLLFCFSGLLWAEVVVTAEVDKTYLTKTDELHFTVTVTGAQGPVSTPEFSLPGFNRYYMMQGTEIINGSQTNTFTYTLLPRFVGTHTIGPVEVIYNGDVYKADAVTVQVFADDIPEGVGGASEDVSGAQNTGALPALEQAIQKQAKAQGRQPVFMTAAVSTLTPYVNQPITLSVRFYYSVPIHNNAPYTKPSVSNIFMESPTSSEGRQRIGNTYFSYFEQRYTISGVTAGEAVIGPASVHYYTTNSDDSVFGMLDHFLGGTTLGKEQSVSSKPIRMQIKPLPTQGKPSSFYGAVGSGYTLTSKVDRNEVEAGEAVTFTLTVQGPGNLKTTGDIKIPDITGFKTYPASPTADWLPNSTSRSFKIFKNVFVPGASGTYTIPSISWSYFDPNTQTYKTLRSKEQVIQVTPSTKQDRDVNFAVTAPTGSGFQTLGQDIHYLKTTSAPKQNILNALNNLSFINWLALMWLTGCIFFAFVGKKSLELKHAFSTARGQLKKAQNYEDISDALAQYLQQKFNISTASTPLRTIEQELKDKGITLQVVNDFAALWTELENYRFAPQAGNDNIAQISERALEVVKKLEANK